MSKFQNRYAVVFALCCSVGTQAYGQTAPRADIRSLTPDAKAALQSALTDSRGQNAAVAVYSVVVAKFGKARPYERILRDEIKQRSDVQQMCRIFLISIPEDKFVKRTKAPVSLKQAAGAAIKFEEGTVALYDRLLTEVPDYPELANLFLQLQAEARDVHLPLLKAALENGGELPKRRVDY